MKSNIQLSSVHSVQIEVDVGKLTSLFSSGVLCAAEVRCLNRSSKDRIWALCLRSCFKGDSKKAELPPMPKRSLNCLINLP